VDGQDATQFPRCKYWLVGQTQNPFEAVAPEGQKGWQTTPFQKRFGAQLEQILSVHVKQLAPQLGAQSPETGVASVVHTAH